MKKYQHYGLIAEDIAHIGVYVIDKEDSLTTILNVLDKHNISAVVVEDRDNFEHYYLISHTDIIRFLAQQTRYLKFLDNIEQDLDLFQKIRAKDLMRGPIKIIDKETPIDEIIQLMHKHGYKRVIVGNKSGQPIGIISTRDILAWNNEFFRKGTPILLCVMENNTGIILSQKFFRQDFEENLLELLGGSISAITSITSEVLKKSGNMRIIEKDYYHIMLEPNGDITALLVADHSSIDLRKKLQVFIEQFSKKYERELEMRKKYPGPINAFKIHDLAKNFKN